MQNPMTTPSGFHIKALQILPRINIISALVAPQDGQGTPVMFLIKHGL